MTFYHTTLLHYIILCLAIFDVLLHNSVVKKNFPFAEWHTREINQYWEWWVPTQNIFQIWISQSKMNIQFSHIIVLTSDQIPICK